MQDFVSRLPHLPEHYQNVEVPISLAEYNENICNQDQMRNYHRLNTIYMVSLNFLPSI